MQRRRALAGLAATAVAATLMAAAAPASAEDWCDHDPLEKVPMPDGRKEHVHITLGAIGESHKKALQRAAIRSEGTWEGSDRIKVTIWVTVPLDGTGPFKTRAMASTQPHGKGTVRASYCYGDAGSAMVLTYTLPR